MAKRKKGDRVGKPTQVDINVGLRVRMRRTELGLSQERLAAAIGVSFQQLQKYERGKNRISASRLHMIARKLERPIEWFFEDAPAIGSTDTAIDDARFRLMRAAGRCDNARVIEAACKMLLVMRHATED
jgi:transcriptional regulator with XRE-family HTH domain